MSNRFRECREKSGLTAAELGKRIGVSQAAVTQWETGKKFPSSETLCKLADFYCVSVDYLLGRETTIPGYPVIDEAISPDTLPCLHGKPVWDESRGWGIVNAALDYVIFMDGSKVVLAEAMNLRTMTPAFHVGYSPASKPISYHDLNKYQRLWIQPISPDSFLREELTGWYQVNSFYVENQYGTRFLFDTYGTRWLAFEMEF